MNNPWQGAILSQQQTQLEQMEPCFSPKCISRPHLPEASTNASVLGERRPSIALLRRYEA